MNPYYPDPTCKCTPTKLCQRHSALESRRASHQQTASQVPSEIPALHGFDQGADTYAHRHAAGLPDSVSHDSMEHQRQAWSIGYPIAAPQQPQMASPFISSPEPWNSQMQPGGLNFSQQAESPQKLPSGSASGQPGALVPGQISSPSQQMLMNQTTYFDMLGGTNPESYTWNSPQQWLNGPQITQNPFWNPSTVSPSTMRPFHQSSFPSAPSNTDTPLLSSPNTSQRSPEEWRANLVPSTAEGYAQNPMLGAMTNFPGANTPGTPTECWMVRSDASVIEENGTLTIELETSSGTRERVPAARFEDVFQDALQDNRTSPSSMRDTWQIRTGAAGKSKIAYIGPHAAGVIKSRKSTVFYPFIHFYRGQSSVMLVDDTDGNGMSRLRPLRSSPYLPNTISTRESGWLMEAILRRDWTITIEDVMDRMLSRIRLDISTYNRWRRHDKAIYEFEDDPRSRY